MPADAGDAAVVRNSRKVKVPADVDIVLYCSSRNDFVSARVAEALEKRGVSNVWVLEGGWRPGRWTDGP